MYAVGWSFFGEGIVICMIDRVNNKSSSLPVRVTGEGKAAFTTTRCLFWAMVRESNVALGSQDAV